MIITIRDIAQVVNFKDIQRSINYHYPEDKNKYQSVLKILKNVKKRKHNDPDEFLQVRITDYECDYFSGKKINEIIKESIDEFRYSIHTTKWGLSFMPWSKIANIPIETETLNRYRFEDIMAHLIWEITFYGNEQETKKVAKELDKRVKEVKSGKAKSVSHDEVMKELGLKKK